MKKKNLIIVAALLTAILVAGVSVFNACKKEAAIDSTTDTDTEEIFKLPMPTELQLLYNQLPIPNFGNIKLVNGDILKFESTEHYEQVYDALNELCEAWMELFLATYDTGTEEDLDAHIKRLGFDERLPLFKFEQKYKTNITHTTLLEEAVEMEQEWLERGGNGPGPDYEITACPIEQTLLSRFYEYCIGDTICQIRPDGYSILIPVSKLSYLNEVRNTSIPELLGRGPVTGTDLPPWWIQITNPPVLVIGPPEPPTYPGGGIYDCGCNFCYCTSYESEFKKSNGTNYKFILTYSFGREGYDKPKTTVTLKNYKLNSKNEWVKDYSSPCRLGFSTKLYYGKKIGDCFDNGSDGKVGKISKAFSKSLKKSYKLVISGGFMSDDITTSYITCRHRGTEFKYNPRGEPKP